MKPLAVALLFFMALSAPAGFAADSPDPTALLQRAYDNYRADSSLATIVMTIHREDWERSLQMKAWTRGDNDALVRFIAPPKDAGNATLKLTNETWVFNPKLNQVIKLRSHERPGAERTSMASPLAESVACEECDLLQRLPELPPGSKARCLRCGNTLVTRPSDPLDRPLALAIAAAITFIVAHTTPLMGLSAVGRHASTDHRGRRSPDVAGGRAAHGRDRRVLRGDRPRRLHPVHADGPDCRDGDRPLRSGSVRCCAGGAPWSPGR